MDLKRCLACKSKFRRRPQVPDQRYCPLPKCKRERRRLWQRDKRAKDPTYKQNESDSRKDWNKRNPGYSRKYRLEHPAYCEQNRLLERQRKRKAKPSVANVDVSTPDFRVPSGTYRLIPVNTDGVANEDVLTVQITVISRTSEPRVMVANETLMAAF